MVQDIDTLHSQMLASKLTQATSKKLDPKKEKGLMDACEGFEAIFTKTLLDGMKDTLPGDALFKESNGRKIFESLHDQYLAEELSKVPSASGLKEFLFNQLKSSL